MKDTLQKLRLPRLAIALVVAGPLLLAACGQDSAGPDAGVTAGDLEELESRVGVLEDRVGTLEEEEDPAVGDQEPELVGQTVTVSGEVTRAVDTRGFVLSSENGEDLEPFGPEIGEGILVVSASDPGVTEGDVVQVVGTVQQFGMADFEDELGIDLDDDLYGEFEGQIALMAQSVDTTPTDDSGSGMTTTSTSSTSSTSSRSSR